MNDGSEPSLTCVGQARAWRASTKIAASQQLHDRHKSLMAAAGRWKSEVRTLTNVTHQPLTSVDCAARRMRRDVCVAGGRCACATRGRDAGVPREMTRTSGVWGRARHGTTIWTYECKFTGSIASHTARGAIELQGGARSVARVTHLLVWCIYARRMVRRRRDVGGEAQLRVCMQAEDNGRVAARGRECA